jgi:hypothetical protein
MIKINVKFKDNKYLGKEGVYIYWMRNKTSTHVSLKPVVHLYHIYSPHYYTPA